MNAKKEIIIISIASAIIGVLAVSLVWFGNPANMGFCIACFIRDTAGSLGLHRASATQYIRPEIVGLVLGSCLLAIGKKEFSVKGGSSPFTRFILGFFVMIGALMFLGCPFRMILRIAGGDFHALFGLAGFAVGIAVGVFFLKRGYSLKRTYKQPVSEGLIFPAIQIIFLILLIASPAFLFFTEAGGGPGGSHAPLLISLGVGLIVGALAQRTRLCMVGGIRDFILFREKRLLIGFGTILLSALIVNIALGYFHPGFGTQPIAHNDELWNFLGMVLTGFGSALLGGCPLRQLVLAGEGNTDSVITWVGLLVGAAFAHNFGLASSGDGPTDAGKVAVILGLVVVTAIACANTFKKKS